MTKKIALQFNKKQYDLKMATYKSRLELEKSIIKEISLLTGEWPIDFDFTNVLTAFYGLLEIQKKKQNSLGLSGEKLSELLGINTANLKALQLQFEGTNGAEEPNVEDHTIFAETETEIAKYNDCINLIKALKSAEKHIVYNHHKIYMALKPMLSVGDNYSLVPDIQFIKSI
jgi:hypothetical protein